MEAVRDGATLTRGGWESGSPDPESKRRERGRRVRPIRVSRGLDMAVQRCECSWQREKPVQRPCSERGFGAIGGLNGERGWCRKESWGQITWGLAGQARCLVFISRAIGSHGRYLSKEVMNHMRN